MDLAKTGPDAHNIVPTKLGALSNKTRKQIFKREFRGYLKTGRNEMKMDVLIQQAKLPALTLPILSSVFE